MIKKPEYMKLANEIVSLDGVAAVKKTNDGKEFDIYYKFGSRDMFVKRITPLAVNNTQPSVVMCNKVWKPFIGRLRAKYKDLLPIGKHIVLRTDFILSVKQNPDNSIVIMYQDEIDFALQFSAKVVANNKMAVISNALLKNNQ